ncbi:hypothetical protein [Leptothoe kymatousa]|uniref:Uncharacterized protein n=1 Tax=Leptothoe kymatousa TAU-MAC 1615 TaxID=2364775 RepID=A0ABS5Y5V9_9CYAN|nr:hypothetical protein [Leptothoe kymatousa]MBT9313239.1 hypothetical protein [Leptothoe kymatousa TAU-MAC 1615]
MDYHLLIKDIPNATVTQYEDTFLITVANSQLAATVLERVMHHKACCWIGLQPQQKDDLPSIYAAYPLKLWLATVATQLANG